MLEEETPYVKGSSRVVPPKADHKHEYFIAVVWTKIRRFDGSISEKKHKISGPTMCVICGHVNRKAYSNATEIEVTKEEFNKKYRGRSRPR